MTFNGPISIFSRRIFIFNFFLQYCNASYAYNEREAFWKRQEAYSNLISEWKYNRWETDEVIQTCLKIDSRAPEVGLNLFFGKEIGYINHIKSLYQLGYFSLYNKMPSSILHFQPANEIILEINSVSRVFYKYWDVCSKRYLDYTSLQVESICAELYRILANYLEKNGWLICLTYLFGV